MKIAYNPGEALTYAPSGDIIFDLAGEAIFAKGVRFDGKLHKVFEKASSDDAEGVNGLVPFPDYNNDSLNRFLREDGKWGDSIRHSSESNNADTVDGYHIVVGSAGDDPNTIYFVL